MQTRGAANRQRPDIRRNVPLAPHCTLGVGGIASHFVETTTPDDVAFALDWARRSRLPCFVLGGGSNLVVGDAGVEGLVIRVANRGVSETATGDRVEITAAAGEPWDDLVRYTVRHDLTGLECLSGIPGSVGATPVQNVGAYGQEVSDTIVAVEAIDRTDLRRVTLLPENLEFGYRDSALKRAPARYVVLGVTFALLRSERPTPRYEELSRRLGMLSPTVGDVREAVLALRREKSMVLDEADPNHRSCGSFFVNPVVTAEVAQRIAASVSGATMPRFEQRDGTFKLSAGWLIERSGLARGNRSGSVGLSSRHALALVCHDGATATAVRDFARSVRDRVEERFGIRLVPEPVFWGFAHGLD